MKTTLTKKISALLLVLCMAAGLAACGGGGGTAAESSPYAGKYISVAGEMLGIVLSGDDISGFSLELKDGGKGTLDADGTSDSIKWSEAEGKLTIEVEGETIEGTFGEDTIVFEDFMGMGLTLTMAKEGTDAASASYLSESDEAMLGTWQSYEVLDILGDDASAQYDPNGLTMVFKDDRTVDITCNGESIDAQNWSNLDTWGSLEDSEYDFTWDLEDGVLSVDTQIGEDYVTYHCSLS